jgi:hypothetical protein
MNQMVEFIRRGITVQKIMEEDSADASLRAKSSSDAEIAENGHFRTGTNYKLKGETHEHF